MKKILILFVFIYGCGVHKPIPPSTGSWLDEPIKSDSFTYTKPIKLLK